MAEVDDFLGLLLITSWLQLVLWSIELFQLIRHHRKFHNDHCTMRLTVLVVGIVDTSSVLVTNIWTYRVCITHFGNMSKVQSEGWELRTMVLLQLVAAVVCQSYLVTRYARVSKDQWLPRCLYLAIAVMTGLGIFAVVASLQSSAFWKAGKIASESMFCTGALVDIAISIVLVHFLLKRVQTDLDKTQKLLRKLVFISIETGLITSAVAIACLVVTITMFYTSNLPYLFATLLGRSYSLTLLFNINMRSSRELGDSTAGKGSPSRGQVSILRLRELHTGSNASVQPAYATDDDDGIKFTKETFCRSDV